MRIGLCGGTFDPLHVGHSQLVMSALKNGPLDRVIVMPAGRPPHKLGEFVSMAGYRHEMAVQAFTGCPDVEVSDLEILRPGSSYTLDTIISLQENLAADDELFLVYGSDILYDIEKWHEPAGILARCPLLLARRGGYDDLKSSTRAEELRQRYGARISFFAGPDLVLSSTQIRQAVQAGQPYKQWLPEKVVKFIHKHSLYCYLDQLTGLDPQLWQDLYELERLIWPLLDRKRLLHSLNVMYYALHLAKIHGVPLEQAGKAALLHDCAKCLPLSEMLQYASRAGDPSLLGDELAHGPAGSWLCQERFKINEPAVLRSIHFHTTGCAGMTALDKIIFIADKVEPARTYQHLAEIRRLAEYDLDQALAVCLTEIDCFLNREKLPSHPYTREASDDLNRQHKNP